MVQSYWELQLRSWIWCCVSVQYKLYFFSLLFFSSHNLIKHETRSVKLKIDFPLSHSLARKKKTVLAWCTEVQTEYVIKAMTRDFKANTYQSYLREC